MVCFAIVIVRNPDMNIGLAALAITLSLSFSKMLGWLVKVCCFTGMVGVGVCCLECLATGWVVVAAFVSRTHARTSAHTPSTLPVSRNTCLVQNISETEQSFNSVERILYYIENTSPEAPHHREDTKPPASWPEKATVDFRGVSMRYRPELPLVLKSIDANIRAGEKIGICGRTGSGKSSLVSLLYAGARCFGRLLSGVLGVGRSLACLVPARGHVLVTWLHKDM